jgi:hypothetical protein
VRDGLFDFGIGKPFGNILGVSMQGEKVVELPESPYSGFPHMDGRMIEFSREGYQVQVFDILYALKLTGTGKGSQLAQTYLEGLDGAGRKVSKAAVLQKLLAVSVEHGPPPWGTCFIHKGMFFKPFFLTAGFRGYAFECGGI